MPDRDVFDQNVTRGWRTASRCLLLGDFDETALKSVIRALGKELRERGCPGFREAVNIVVETLQAVDHETSRICARHELNQLRLQYRNKNTELLIVVCLRMVSDEKSERTVIGPSKDGTIDPHSAVATRILSKLAISWMSPAQLIAEAVKYELVSYQTARIRKENAIAILGDQPATVLLADQLLKDSSGAAIRGPRVTAQRKSIDELLFASLTD